MKLLDKLEALAKEHEQKAAGYRLVIAELSQNGHAKAIETLPGKLQRAIQQRKGPAGKGSHASKLLGQRQRTGWVYAAYTDQPRNIADVAAELNIPLRMAASLSAVLFRYGYLKKKDGGYLHTAKVYNAEAPS